MSCVSVRCDPTKCARPIACRTSAAACGGQTVAYLCPRTMKCPGRCSRQITASALAARCTRFWCLMNCRYPLAGASRTPPPDSARASNSTADGPFSGPPADGDPCSAIASVRSAAMLAITCGSWMAMAVWWMK